MGNPFSKGGFFTKLVEAVPGGGFITAPFHALHGNMEEATKAAMKAVTSSISVLPVPGVSTVISNLTKDAMKELLKPPRTGGPPINGRLRSAVDAADEAKKAGDNEKAARIIVEEGRRCVADNAKALSAEAGGRRRVRSFHGTYLRGTPDDRADFVPVPREWECWYIEDWKGKVALKAIHSPGRFLRAYGNGHVGVAPHHPNDCEEELWTPLQVCFFVKLPVYNK
ncbi:hypothetical protein WR25_02593 isoform D [Diploscapter pachys]|uniref:Uncharacterized protein n=1 Tax=Diploscapter pachys TaxID=2018661 RepID=A0A2A2LA57_9BILA|nr:hypothetical protein WR25_02593 isoform D [Diploscapter pachys]